MNYFPNSKEEISLITFIAKYQYLAVNDTKYFFGTTKYYKKRITRLVQQKYLRRTNHTLVLDEVGIKYVKQLKFEYHPINRNPKYITRLLYLSNFGAYFFKSNALTYTPSFSIKDKEMYTVTGRKYIGTLDINGYEYLIFHVSKDNDKRYIQSIAYEIQKEQKYKNIIILYESGLKIDINNFIFGNAQVLIIEDTEENRNKLQYLNSIRWIDIIEECYQGKVQLAGYKFCDYTDYKDKFVSYFYFIDTEKINRIKQFLAENKFRNVDIICPKDLKEELQKYLPKSNYLTVDVEKYINRNRNSYG